MKYFWRMCLGAFFSLSLVACGQAKPTHPTPESSATPSSNETVSVPAAPATTNAPAVHVVASFSVLGDMVSAVGGERVQVDNLVGINQDSHVYQPTPQDAQKIAHAQVFVVNGLGFEGWLERLEKNADFKGIKVVVTDGLPALSAPQHGEEGHDHEHDHTAGGMDPHAWQDPALVAQYYVPNIIKGLSQADPAGATYYQQHGQAYINQLNQLTIQIQQILGRFPREQRKVVVSHRSFEYFGKAFGVDFYAVQGMSTESQASAKQVAELINLIKVQNIHALYAENISDPKMIEQISAETGVRVGNKLYSETLSEKTGYAPTYLRMMQYNADQIAAGVR